MGLGPKQQGALDGAPAAPPPEPAARSIQGYRRCSGSMSLNNEQEQHHPQIPARDGSLAAANERQGLPSARADDGDSQDGDASRCSVPYLPEDIWHNIHSLLPMRAAARAACISPAFLHSWRHRPNLALNRKTLETEEYSCGMSSVPYEEKVDSILRNHSGSGLKILEIEFDYGRSKFSYADRWVRIAVVPGIEELALTLYKDYYFPCSLLCDGVRNSIRCLHLGSCAFHPTATLGPLRSLTSLHLSSVRITGDELECLLSNSLALEHLELIECEEINFLKIPCVLKQLRCLIASSCRRLEVIESKAPNLSRIDTDRGPIKIPLPEALQMKQLYMSDLNTVHYARTELPSFMQNLERLELFSADEEVSVPMLPTKFLCLKHLNISIREGHFSPPYDYFSLVSFLDASPSLETLFLDVRPKHLEHKSVHGGSSDLRQLPEYRHGCLKSVKIVGFSSAKSLVELACCIVKSAVSLEDLVLDTLPGEERCSDEDVAICWPISKHDRKESSRAVMAIRRYIEGELPARAELTTLEPCTRCHTSGAPLHWTQLYGSI